MSISSCFPIPNKFFQNEVYTLERIQSSPIFKKHFRQLVSDAEDYLSRNDTLIRRKEFKGFDLDFKSQINDVNMNGVLGTAHIGALIKATISKYELLTYDLTLCNNTRIIRKFHFDYTPKNIKKKRPHPVFHLQYPGELSSQLLSLKLAYSHLECDLSEPRIPFTPMSLALTINLILKEFPDERTHRVVEDSSWRALIKKNETELLGPYYRECNTFFSSLPTGKLFINDFCYDS